MALTLILNGQPRTLEDLTGPARLASVVAALGLKSDRVAVEHNGEIAPRLQWDQLQVHAGDKLEVVHFVGGGACQKPLIQSLF